MPARTLWVLFLVLAASLRLPAAEEESPQEKKRPDIYDEKASAEDQIESALARAKRERRRVLIQWGANWCGWCHLLHERMKSDPDLQRKLATE